MKVNIKCQAPQWVKDGLRGPPPEEEVPEPFQRPITPPNVEFYGDTSDIFGHHPPLPRPGDLYFPTGLGPHKLPPQPYHGPLFPAPMLPSSVEVTAKEIELCNSARRHWSMGKTKVALNNYDRAIAENPADAHLYFERAQLQWQEGDLQEAEASLEKAVELNPKHRPAWVSLVKVLLEQGRSNDAGIRLSRMFWAVSFYHTHTTRALARMFLTAKPQYS
jgi:tetratricopeptide (TPR) repeat protein